MQIGIGLPNTLEGVRPERLLEWARKADAGPFSSLGAVDRLAYPCFDAFTTLAVAAGATHRIRIMTTVLLAPLHNEGVLAQQLATLAALSGQRLTVGIGIGARPEDYAAAPASFEQRGDHLEHMLARLRGPYPLLLGGRSEKALQRAARHADGYISSGTVKQTAQAWKRFQTLWQKMGREGRPRLAAGFYWCLGNRDAAVEHVHRYYAFNPEQAKGIAAGLADSPEQVRARIAALADAGVDEAIAWPCTDDLGEVERLASVLF